MRVGRWQANVAALVCALALGACGEPPAAPVARPAAAPARPPEPTTPSARAAVPASAPASPGEHVASSARVVPAPEPASAGALTITAEACTLEGPEIVGDESFTTIGPLTWASDGALYLLDAERAVRRYTIATADACLLRLDTAFGDGGVLARGGGGPRSLAADAVGHVYVSSSTGGTDRLTGAAVDLHCDTRGTVVVSPDGTSGFALFGSGPLERITFGEASCTIEPFATSELFAHVHSIAFVSPTQILVTGERGTAAPIRARLHDLSGAPLGPAFGDTTGAVGAPDHFCRVHAAIACANGLCVLDGNCRALRVFGPAPAHEAVDAIDLARLLGLSYPWVGSLTELRSGVAYVAASQERTSGGAFDGFVFRLRAR